MEGAQLPKKITEVEQSSLRPTLMYFQLSQTSGRHPVCAHAAWPGWRVLEHGSVAQLRDIDSSSGDSRRQLSKFKVVQSIKKEIEDEACSLSWLEFRFQKYWTTHWNPSLFRGALIYIQNSQPLQWSRILCKAYHTHKCFPSENASRLVVMAAGFNPAKNDSHLTLPYQCEIHLLAMGSSLWTDSRIRAATTIQIHFIPGQQQRKGWEQPYKQTCFFTPRHFSSRQNWCTEGGNNPKAPTDVAYSELHSLRLSRKPALWTGTIFLLKAWIVKVQMGDDSQKAFL